MEEKMNGFESDLLFGAMRYYIGRSSILAACMPQEIGLNCYGRFQTDDRQLFAAYDINREISYHLNLAKPRFIVPDLGWKNIYPTAIDCFCMFVNGNGITEKSQLIKYKEIEVKFGENSDSLTFNTSLWDNDDKDKPKLEYYYLNDIHDLFRWNHLVHLFDTKHHKTALMKDGSKIEYFETYMESSSYSNSIEYKKVKMDVNRINWNCRINEEYIEDPDVKFG